MSCLCKRGASCAVPAPFPCGSVWIAACFGFINNMVGARCVIILRDIIAAFALVTCFPLHSSRAGSLPKTPGPVACLGLTSVMEQPQNPGLWWCYWVQPCMGWSLGLSDAAAGVLQKRWKDMGEPVNVHLVLHLLSIAR